METRAQRRARNDDDPKRVMSCVGADVLALLGHAASPIIKLLSFTDVRALASSTTGAARAIALTMPDWVRACGDGRGSIVARSKAAMRRLLAASPTAPLRHVVWSGCEDRLEPQRKEARAQGAACSIQHAARRGAPVA